MNRKPLDLSDPNPWFRTMYQKLHNCTLRGDFSVTSYGTLCLENLGLEHYNLDIYSVFTVIAIFATGYGLLEYCNSTDLIPCIHKTRLHGNEDLLRDLKEAISGVQLYNNDGFSGERNFYPFNLRGDGNFGYNVRSIQPPTSRSPDYEAIHVFTFGPKGSMTEFRTTGEAVNFYKRGVPFYSSIENLCTSCNCTHLPSEESQIKAEVIALYSVIAALSILLIAITVYLIRRAVLSKFNYCIDILDSKLSV